MNPIAIWYHCKCYGSGIPNEKAALEIVLSQMKALKDTALSEVAGEIHIGINGDHGDRIIAEALGAKQMTFYLHGCGASTELPTFSFLRKWLPMHLNWFVMYHHSKGVTQPNDEPHHHHRRVMQKYVVEHWFQCIEDLGRGFDAVGINWIPRSDRPVPGNARFFVGNFWWSNSNYLMELPALPERVPWSHRVLAEQWIGMSNRTPLILDYERPELSQWCIESGAVKK